MSGHMITGNGIELFRMLSIQGRLKLEMAGLKFRGRSTFAIVKEQFGLKGNKQKVYDQFTLLVEEAKKKVQPGDIKEI